VWGAPWQISDAPRFPHRAFMVDTGEPKSLASSGKCALDLATVGSNSGHESLFSKWLPARHYEERECTELTHFCGGQRGTGFPWQYWNDCLTEWRPQS
jgi:hypothetical protein